MFKDLVKTLLAWTAAGAGIMFGINAAEKVCEKISEKKSETKEKPAE